jgi:hypothetical protein
MLWLQCVQYPNIYWYCVLVSYISYNRASWDSKIPKVNGSSHLQVRPLSSAWFTKLCKSTEMTCNSKVGQFWLYKKHLRLTLDACMRIPTCAPFMQNVSQSCPRICSCWHVASEVIGIKSCICWHLIVLMWMFKIICHNLLVILVSQYTLILKPIRK